MTRDTNLDRWLKDLDVVGLRTWVADRAELIADAVVDGKQPASYLIDDYRAAREERRRRTAVLFAKYDQWEAEQAAERPGEEVQP